MYIEASAPRNQSDTAILVSPAYSPTSQCYMEMFYSMNGRNIGTLSVYARNINNKLTQLWTKSGNHGNGWDKTVIQLGNLNSTFQVLILGVVGNGPLGDIAIDDIIFGSRCTKSNTNITPPGVTIPVTRPTVNPCGANQFKCASGTCIDSKKVCDLTLDCQDGSDEGNCGPCSFEFDTCNWMDISNGRYNWTRHSGKQNSVTAAGPATGKNVVNVICN